MFLDVSISSPSLQILLLYNCPFWGVFLVVCGAIWLSMFACWYLFSRCLRCHMFQLKMLRTQNFGLFYTPCVWGRFSQDWILLDLVRVSHSDKNDLHNSFFNLTWWGMPRLNLHVGPYHWPYNEGFHSGMLCHSLVTFLLFPPCLMLAVIVLAKFR